MSLFAVSMAWGLANSEPCLSLHWKDMKRKVQLQGYHWCLPLAQTQDRIADAQLSALVKRIRKGRGEEEENIDIVCYLQCYNLKCHRIDKSYLHFLRSISCYPSHEQALPMLIASFQELYNGNK